MATLYLLIALMSCAVMTLSLVIPTVFPPPKKILIVEDIRMNRKLFSFPTPPAVPVKKCAVIAPLLAFTFFALLVSLLGFFGLSFLVDKALDEYTGSKASWYVSTEIVYDMNAQQHRICTLEQTSCRDIASVSIDKQLLSLERDAQPSQWDVIGSVTYIYRLHTAAKGIRHATTMNYEHLEEQMLTIQSSPVKVED